ncbi:globin domain-containing protein [Thermomonospora umbrina]|uniref:Hemoglobin-like flavoprotein n=1 Tax=Thermomonospora umbrina TaxID=111806 RepID=A0A3D9SQZ3_9ACTN|nr:globin domain-containing protein [Thermomonospora umbrina]REE98047.1 hemoglobin-like flavoprotein [Thermomonospora umbrina]
MSSQPLKENFALVGAHGEDVAAYFYADLFSRAPAVRPMFPASMEKQQEKLLAALSAIVSLLDDPAELVPFLEDLGRRHDGLGVRPEHFPVVGASLLATLAHFSGDAWNEDLEREWAAAYGTAADVMKGALA